MTEPERHDWPTIVREIIAAYGLRYKKKLTLYKLGQMIDRTNKRTVKSWLSGQEPVHHKGQLLLAYHAEFHSELGQHCPITIGQTAET